MTHFTEFVVKDAALAALRDALLPKLMSGEIRVKGVESALTEHL
jgi:hypothetical protein